MNEKIKNGVKKIEKQETNMIKNLSYISNINKNKKEINNLLIECIKSL